MKTTTQSRLAPTAALMLLFAAAPASAQSLVAATAALDRGDYEVALQELRPLGEKGDAEGQYLLGMMFLHGHGVEQDDQEALAWLQKSADQDIAHAQASLGNMYRDGRGVSKDLGKASSLFRKAAEQGDPWGQFLLGTSYEFGEGVEVDPSAAVLWYGKAAAQGLPIGKTYLATMLRFGLGVEKDLEEAARLYREAAEQSEPGAQLALGQVYMLGHGVQRDVEEALKWVRMAAEQGDADAQYQLARYYEDPGLKPDQAEARSWYEKAAEQGHLEAQMRLAALTRNAPVEGHTPRADTSSSSDPAIGTAAATARAGRLDADQVHLIVDRVAAGKGAVSIDSPVNDPKIVFVFHEPRATVSDRTREDVFTGEEAYVGSIIHCAMTVDFFTTILDRKVHVGASAGPTFPQTLVAKLTGPRGVESYNLWTGGFSSSNILETSLSGGELSLTTGSTEAIAHVRAGEYASRSEADAAAATVCRMDDVKSIELANFEGFSEGFLIEGETKRTPFFSFSALYLIP